MNHDGAVSIGQRRIARGIGIHFCDIKSTLRHIIALERCIVRADHELRFSILKLMPIYHFDILFILKKVLQSLVASAFKGGMRQQLLRGNMARLPDHMRLVIRQRLNIRIHTLILIIY